MQEVAHSGEWIRRRHKYYTIDTRIVPVVQADTGSVVRYFFSRKNIHDIQYRLLSCAKSGNAIFSVLAFNHSPQLSVQRNIFVFGLNIVLLECHGSIIALTSF